MRALGGFLLLAAAAAADPATTIDKAFATRVAAIGDRAAKEGQEATARRILARAIELDPDQPIARALLGHKRTGKVWKPPAAPLLGGTDKSAAASARFLRELRAEEDRRAAACVRAGLTDRYPELLARLPRNEELHKALGHEKVGTRYARPELLEAAKRYDAQQARWRELAAPATLGDRADVDIPGFGSRQGYRVEARFAAGTLPESELLRGMRSMPAPHAFLRELFGNSVRTWESYETVFVTRENYPICVKAAYPPGEERDHFLRCGLLRKRDLAVFLCDDGEHAADTYAHAVGIYSADNWCTPPHGEGERRSYAWFAEGMGYYASMALHKTGITYYRGDESSRKIPPTVPPPEGRYRQDLLPWLQGQLLDGTTEPLRNVSGRTLNSLDLLMSLEAWSFLEFLAAYNPEALRDLPHALRAEEEGAYADRSERALEACFGKGFAELEPLWRAFVLEIM